MGNLSLREAAKTFNVSRPTLTKALNTGKLSGIRNSKGQWEIPPSELARVYQPRATEAGQSGKPEQEIFTATNTSSRTDVDKLKAALELAEARAKAAEELAQERAERIEDLRRMLPRPDQGRTQMKFWDLINFSKRR